MHVKHNYSTSYQQNVHIYAKMLELLQIFIYIFHQRNNLFYDLTYLYVGAQQSEKIQLNHYIFSEMYVACI